jgi:flagellar hook-associated protein 2
MTTNFVSALGAGSGIDVKSLAENLVEAERAPRKERIDSRIAKTEAKISGYGAMKFALSDLQAAFAKVNDASEFSSSTATNSQPSAFGVSTTTTAGIGNYSIEVTQIAKATRIASTSFLASDTSLHTGPFDLTITDSNGVDTTIGVTTATPTGMVKAINDSTDTTGLTAQLLNTGNGYTVVVSGSTGQSHDFTLSSNVADVSFLPTKLQTAQDAQFQVNGLNMTRSTNQFSDVIDGVTLDLYGTTTLGSPARLDLNRQTGAIKDNLKLLVKAYNDFDESLKILADRASTVEDFGGVLAGDSLLQRVRSQVRSMITSDYKIYATPGNAATEQLNPDVYAARHVGLSIDRNGLLTLDEVKLDAALTDNFDQVVTMFSANANNQSIYSPSPGGLAGDAVKSIDKTLRSTGLIAQQSETASSQIKTYKKELVSLEEQMTRLLARYTAQFGTMDSIVGQSSSTRASLTSSFEGLMSMYTNK